MSSHVSAPPAGEQPRHSGRVRNLAETLLETPGDVTTAEALHDGADTEHAMTAPCYLRQLLSHFVTV